MAGIVLTLIALLLPVTLIGLVELCKSLSVVHDNQSLFLVMMLGLLGGTIAYLTRELLSVSPWVVYLIVGLLVALGVSKIYDEWINKDVKP